MELRSEAVAEKGGTCSCDGAFLESIAGGRANVIGAIDVLYGGKRTLRSTKMRK